MVIRYTFGHYLSRSVLVNGSRVKLTPLENSLFFMLYVNMGRMIPTYDLIDALWGDREDGGPLCTDCVISQTLYSLRRKTGLSIHTQRGTVLEPA